MSKREMKVIEYTCDQCGTQTTEMVASGGELPEGWQQIAMGSSGHQIVPLPLQVKHFCSNACWSQFSKRQQRDA